MVTKEQCLVNRILEEIGYGRAPELAQTVVTMYNQGKNYLSDCVFINNNNGLNQALERFSPAEIVKLVLGEDTEYDKSEPFFIFSNGTLHSIDEYDFQRMLKPEDISKILNQDVLSELSESGLYDAFETYIRENYPQAMKNWTGDWEDQYLYNFDLINGNWDELAKTLSQPVNEGRVLEMTDKEIKEFVSEAATKIYRQIKEGKSGIEIDPENKGKFNATKKRTGKSTEELTHSKNPLTKKRAIFAQNCKKWSHKK